MLFRIDQCFQIYLIKYFLFNSQTYHKSEYCPSQGPQIQLLLEVIKQVRWGTYVGCTEILPLAQDNLL